MELLKFGDLKADTVYPLYERVGKKIKERKCKRSQHNGYEALDILDKLGRNTYYWSGSPQHLVLYKRDMSARYISNFYLNKEDLFRVIINDLKKEKQKINKKIMDVLNEMHMSKKDYFDNE